MKIEKIDENKIKCTINQDDFSVRGISVSELSYGSEAAKELFREVIQLAFEEIGFQGDGFPLIVEAIPLSSNNMILIITKDTEVEELDPRFSKFAPEKHHSPELNREIANQTVSLSLLNEEGIEEEFDHQETSEFVSLPDVIEEYQREKEAFSPNQTEEEKIYSFSSLSDISRLAVRLPKSLKLPSSIYKNPSKNSYYLILNMYGVDKKSLGNLHHILSDYSSLMKGNYATSAYVEEHFEPILKEEALSILSAIES